MFCNVEDVACEGSFELTPQLRESIEYKIQNITEYIQKRSSKDLKNEKHHYAQMACVYGVLTWLESKRLIRPSRVVSLREGNINLILDDNQPPSYKELYEHYMNLLLPPPPVGTLT